MNAIENTIADSDLSEEAILASMLAGLDDAGLDEIDLSEEGGPELATDAAAPVIAATPVIVAEDDLDAVLGDLADDSAIEKAVAEIGQAEAMQALYKEADADADIAALFSAPGDKPATEEIAQKSPKKAKRNRKAKKADEKPADDAAVNPVVPAEVKPPVSAAVRYNGRRTNADEVLKAKLGSNWRDMLVLEMADVDLSPEELDDKQSELLKLLSTRPGTGEVSSQQKVAEKVVMLFKWLKDGGSLNKVMEITFKVLARDGYILTGKNGNLHKDLLAKPYSPGTANAQGGQMASMLPMLKIVTPDGKGRFVPNKDSVILTSAKAMLGLQ